MLSYQKLDQDDQILTDDPASRKLGDLDVHVAVVVLPDHEIRFFWPLLARGSHILRNPSGFFWLLTFLGCEFNTFCTQP